MFMFRVTRDEREARIPRTIRFTEELFEKLNTAAIENDVSFNQLVLQCCKYALDDLDSLETVR